MFVTGWKLFRNYLVTVKHLTSLSISTFENTKLRFTKLIQSLSESEPIAISSSDTDDCCQGLGMCTLRILGNKRTKQHSHEHHVTAHMAGHIEGTDV